MIGVIANPGEHDVVREFFELFKTPWEFYRDGQRYDVLLCTGEMPSETSARVILFYASRPTRLDAQQSIPVDRRQAPAGMLRYRIDLMPIYGQAASFTGQRESLLKFENSGEDALRVERSGETTLVRIGYDLFSEVRFLLASDQGQPKANAQVPTLELHIALLRDLTTGFGAPLVEIPPVPEGYRFIVCLTHDVDHPCVRAHNLDHTVLGFLFRATLGALWDFAKGEISFRRLLDNWAVVARLPLVHLGLTPDFWRDFGDRYLEIEKGLRSTFFLIPFRDHAGKRRVGSAPGFRASRYGAKDLSDVVRKLIAADCEVGLHGIDAWLDATSGAKELNEIRDLTAAPEIGVRMHWLFYDHGSPAALEAAGAAYDSTVGYNETVGYRAGTTQVYKPLEARRLLELPLHLMDTALFYKSYLALSRQDAAAKVKEFVENALRFGGCLTINWHDRSVVPERFWAETYADLIRDLKANGAWFATAAQAVAWFHKRRSATFISSCAASENARAEVAVSHSENLPGLRLRFHRNSANGCTAIAAHDGYTDFPVEEHVPAGLTPTGPVL